MIEGRLASVPLPMQREDRGHQAAASDESQWAATVSVRAEGLLLRDNVERACEPRAGGHGASNNAGWLAGAWDEPAHEQPPRSGRSPKTERAPRYRGQGRGGMVAPILMLHRQRDARYERPCALCERLRTLHEHESSEILLLLAV